MGMALGSQGLFPSPCHRGLSSSSGLGYGWTIPPATAQLCEGRLGGGQLLTLSCSSVLKLLKMAVGMRALLDTVMQALPQVAGRWGGQKGRVLLVGRRCPPKGQGHQGS